MTLQSKTNVVLAGLLIGLWLSSAVPSGASAQEAPARRDPAGACGRDEKKRTADPRRETPIPYLPSRKTCDSASLRSVVRLGTKMLQGKYRATVLAGDSPDAYNDVDRPQRVVPQTLDVSFTDGQTELPPHSLTIVEVE